MFHIPHTETIMNYRITPPPFRSVRLDALNVGSIYIDMNWNRYYILSVVPSGKEDFTVSYLFWGYGTYSFIKQKSFMTYTSSRYNTFLSYTLLRKVGTFDVDTLENKP